VPASRHGVSAVSSHSTTLRYWLGRHNGGDPAAINELLRFSQDRVLDHIRARIRGFARLRPYADSQDVLVCVQLKIAERFKAERFKDLPHFLGVTGWLVRNQLVDFVRKYFGPRGAGTQERHVEPDGPDDPARAPDPADSPSDVALRAEIDEVIAGLPPEHLVMFDLLFYNRMTRADAADALGVSLSTVDHRWVAAREEFLRRYGGELPF
jgi:RNA polymerase sigma factor (sigma-70 family)